MSLHWLEFGAAIVSITTFAGAQTEPAPHTTPPAYLTRIDDKSAEILYHDANNKEITQQFVVNSKTNRQPKLAKNDLVLVTYVDEGRAHVAQSIRIFAFELHPNPQPPDSANVSSNDAPPEPGENSTQWTTTTFSAIYSVEGASAMNNYVYTFLHMDSINPTRGPLSTHIISLKRSGLAFSGNDECDVVNVVDLMEVESGCQTDHGFIRSDLELKKANAIFVPQGSSALLDRVETKPDGLEIYMSVAQGNQRYKSTLKFPFDQGRLPAQSSLNNRLMQVIYLDSAANAKPSANSKPAAGSKADKASTPPKN